ncbi:MAG: 50S ribosomal protein L35 [Spirochaetales bacterium]|jgi:large subunit ribosomal protein L35|nr:50S ribosomal protein L35 [Spirochaetales bacterium]
MPKIKTKKAASKRFSYTANGKVKYKKMGMRKKLSKKSNRRKRVLNNAGMLSPAENKKIQHMMPNS